MRDLLFDVAERAARYRDELAERPVVPTTEALERLARLNEPLPQKPAAPAEVLRLLDEIGSPATTASAGGRYFGFVVGSSLPATVAAGWLATAWDQNAGMEAESPVGAALEAVCVRWLIELFDLPATTGAGFVTGATMANFTGLAAARHALLRREGWDVERHGLFSAPPIQVIVGDEVHASVLKALSLLGLGRDRVHRVPTDQQGRMRPELLPRLDGRTIICAQAGHVGTGACDPLDEICSRAREINAWVHVDGAFGMWAAVAPNRAYMVRGLGEADSWATDAHKWLNVPYDCGLVLVREESNLRAAMSATAAYLIQGEGREPDQYVPEMSRRARGVEVWAALKSLGRQGLADLIERCCRHAAFFADGLRRAGYEVWNEVVLNQVLVSFGSDQVTRRVIAELQREGTCWCGGTSHRGRAAMRISVSSWATTEDDCTRSLQSMLAVAAGARVGEESSYVRPALERDLDQLAQIWYDGWHEAHAELVPAELTRLRTLESFRERLHAALSSVRVAGRRDRLAGFCLVKGDELYQLFVSPDARGTGIAAALLADAEARLADNGIATAWLACAIGNERAARFYEKCGWHRARNMINHAETSDGPFTLEVWRYEKNLRQT